MDITKIGFNLGWDYALYRIGLPDLPEELSKPFLDGYKEAKARTTKKTQDKIPDRFVRKWLCLRRNAYARRRTFDEKITPDLIKDLDVRHCPVTGLALTHGTGLETDWSFDRVNNDAGYAAGNLIVVSAKANIAKDSMNVRDVVSVITGKTRNDELTHQEWLRWLLIMSLAIPFKRPDGSLGLKHILAPCVIRPPRGLPVSPGCILQMAIAYRAAGAPELGSSFGLIADKLPKAERRLLNALLHDTEKFLCRTQGGFDPLIIWGNEKLFMSFAETYKSIESATLENATKAGLRPLGYMQGRVAASLAEWGMEHGGYLPEINGQNAAPGPSF